MIDENEPVKIATAVREVFGGKPDMIVYTLSLIAAGKLKTHVEGDETLITVKSLREAHDNYFSDDKAGPQEVAEQSEEPQEIETTSSSKPIKLKKFNR